MQDFADLVYRYRVQILVVWTVFILTVTAGGVVP